MRILAFRTPGIIPDNARSRKQIRQMPNFRRYARERPQRWQRLCCRTPNVGLRFDFSTMALRAILLPLCRQVNCKDVRIQNSDFRIQTVCLNSEFCILTSDIFAVSPPDRLTFPSCSISTSARSPAASFAFSAALAVMLACSEL